MLSEAEHAQQLAWVAFTHQRTLDKLQAKQALRQLQALFPAESGA